MQGWGQMGGLAFKFSGVGYFFWYKVAGGGGLVCIEL